MDTEDEETRLRRELRVNRLKEQIRESKARQTLARLPGLAVACVTGSAGIGVAALLAVALSRILR